MRVPSVSEYFFFGPLLPEHWTPQCLEENKSFRSWMQVRAPALRKLLQRMTRMRWSHKQEEVFKLAHITPPYPLDSIHQIEPVPNMTEVEQHIMQLLKDVEQFKGSELLDRSLKKFHLMEHECGGNGECLFLSFIDQYNYRVGPVISNGTSISTIPSTPKELRASLIPLMLADPKWSNWESELEDTGGSNILAAAQTLEQYVNAGVWNGAGSDLLLAGLCQQYKVNVKIIEASTGSMTDGGAIYITKIPTLYLVKHPQHWKSTRSTKASAKTGQAKAAAAAAKGTTE